MKADSMHQPRIIVLTSTFPRWQNDPEPAFIFELSRRLCPKFNVTVISPRTPGAKKQERMSGLRVVRFPYFINRWEKLAMHGGGILNNLKSNPLYYFLVPFFLLGQLRALIHLLRKERFDLIHAHWLIPQGFIAALGMILTGRKIQLVCTSHGGDLFALRGPILQFLKKWVINKSQALTVVSRAMKKTVVDMGVEPDKVEVISMGVDLKHLFTPDQKLTRRKGELLFVGRLVEGKGIEMLLEILPGLLNEKIDAHLSVAGAGPLEKKLRELARKLQITEQVDFLGLVNQALLPDLYRQATLAVFPFMLTKKGVQEGFGLVVVEAMGCECPVLAGDLPAIHDIITHEKNGLIFPSGDVQALTESIIRLLKDSGLRLELGREGRKTVVERFDWDIIAGKYAVLYKKLIK